VTTEIRVEMSEKFIHEVHDIFLDFFPLDFFEMKDGFQTKYTSSVKKVRPAAFANSLSESL